MLDTLATAFRSGDLVSWSENLCDEASSYIYTDSIQKKTEATSGGHDDELIAVMVALQLRENLPLTEVQRHQVVNYASI